MGFYPAHARVEPPQHRGPQPGSTPVSKKHLCLFVGAFCFVAARVEVTCTTQVFDTPPSLQAYTPYIWCRCLLKITNALSLYLLLFIAVLAKVTGERLGFWSTRIL